MQFQANEGEVADVFEMPLREALTLSRYYPLDIHRAGHTHRIYLSGTTASLSGADRGHHSTPGSAGQYLIRIA